MNAKELLAGFYEKEADFDNLIVDGIEKHRKSSAKITLKEPADKIVVRQKNHDFKFGCNAFMLESFSQEEQDKEDIYKELFANLFNQAVVPFYWSDLEPEQDKLRFGKDSPKIYRRPAPDVVLEFCQQHGIDPKGHCLLWNNFVPKWLAKYSTNERKRLVEKRFKEIATEYGDKITEWDIVNESASNYLSGVNTLFEDWDEFGMQMGEKYFSKNKRILNETNQALWLFYSRSGKYYPFGYQLEQFKAKGIDFDMIGLQYHMFITKENMPSTKKDFLNPDVMMGILKDINSYNKPISLSEITVPSWFGKNKEDMQIQAEITEFLYKLWFSIENMHSIVWWNLVDGYAAYCPPNSNSGENKFGGGLVNFDMTKKPVYDTLDRLINKEWKTEVTAKQTKELEFRGFHGAYEAEIWRGGKSIVKEFLITKGKDNNLQF